MAKPVAKAAAPAPAAARRPVPAAALPVPTAAPVPVPTAAPVPTATAATGPPVLTEANLQQVLDAYGMLNKDMPAIAPNGIPGLLTPVQPLMKKIMENISLNNGVFSAPSLALTQADIQPVVDIYNLLTPGLKGLVPQIIPPLLLPILKVMLPNAGIP